ncbi:MFS transporter [Rugosibacter aromaticivorans]|uniref:MFS transporter n=1 Tax=Rugosibacter aromaticivorans TaxID=1565605 RepID=A0A0C5JL06_9PROT|nr:MFS transporter [Rugosibacter aromaticivorans]AJP48051.1 MFS transporter [Rugosibacter aromaticivorans]TBR16298.1 MAG: MFS transporter [Rugosibacter sp.]
MNQARRLSAWYFWYFAFVGVFQPYFSLYLQSLAMSAGRIAVLMSLGQMIRLVAPLFWGWLADHAGQRVKIVVMSTGAALASFSAVFLTQDFLGLLLSLTVLHFFWSASLPLVEALTLAHLTDHPERYGRIRLWGSVGFIFAVLGMGWLLDILPITLLLWVGWALLSGTVVSALLLKEAVPGAIHTASSLRMVLSQPKVVFLLVAGLFMIAAHGVLYVFYSIHLVAHGYGKTVVGLLWTLGVLAEIIVFLLMPRIAQRVSLRHLLLACFALAVLRFMLIGWQVDSLSVLFFAQCLHGATFGAHHVATMAALNRWFSSGQQARAQAIYGSVAYGIGGLTGGLLAGALWESAGPAMTFSVSALLALIGFCLVWHGVPASSGRPVVR